VTSRFNGAALLRSRDPLTPAFFVVPHIFYGGCFSISILFLFGFDSDRTRSDPNSCFDVDLVQRGLNLLLSYCTLQSRITDLENSFPSVGLQLYDDAWESRSEITCVGLGVQLYDDASGHVWDSWANKYFVDWQP
jgi:hypothetical protein